MKYYELEGLDISATLNDFLLKKCIPRDLFEHEVIDQGSKGFLGIGKKPSKIRVKFDDIEYMKRKSRLLISDILSMAGFTEIKIEISHEINILSVNIISDDHKVLIGRQAKTLDAIQFLIDKIMRDEETKNIRIVLDVNNYRTQLTKRLKEKTLQKIKNVRQTGKREKFEPLVPILRQEIHSLLKKFPDIRSESYGKGLIKPIYLIPTKKINMGNNNLSTSPSSIKL